MTKGTTTQKQGKLEYDNRVTGHITRDVTFKELSDGGLHAMIPVVVTEKGSNKKSFKIFRHYVKDTQQNLIDFYKSLEKSNFVTLYTEINGSYENVVATFDNTKK